MWQYMHAVAVHMSGMYPRHVAGMWWYILHMIYDMRTIQTFEVRFEAQLGLRLRRYLAILSIMLRRGNYIMPFQLETLKP